ncbi:metallophosphoesterase [Desulfotomaculum defluvii]
MIIYNKKVKFSKWLVIDIKIVHISDLHFGSKWPFKEIEILSSLNELIEEINCNELFLLITGDVSFQGNSDSYRDAQRFFNTLLSKNIIRRKNILLCPGNHDIIKGKLNFQDFDVFSYSLRRDNVFTFSNKNNVLYNTQECSFLGINSAYKFDYTYGIVDIDSIEENLRANKGTLEEPNRIRIAFLHHSLINQFEGDISSVRNAYKLFLLLDKYDFDFIFHGHQHSNQILPIGKNKIYCFGARTLSFPSEGYVNGLNVYDIDLNAFELNYCILTNDVPNKISSGFISIKEEISK